MNWVGAGRWGSPREASNIEPMSGVTHCSDGMGFMEPGHRVLAAWVEEAGVGLSDSSLLSFFARSAPQPGREGRRFPVLP